MPEKSGREGGQCGILSLRDEVPVERMGGTAVIKVVSSAQMRALEEQAAAAGVPLSGMMENAGAAAVRLMRKKI